MQELAKQKPPIVRIVFALILLSFGASHGLTGFLANIGWYKSLGIDFDAWYMHPAYQSMCWFAIGIALTMLIPMWVEAIRSNRLNDANHDSR